jgi:hypothetical protein
MHRLRADPPALLFSCPHSAFPSHLYDYLSSPPSLSHPFTLSSFMCSELLYSENYNLYSMYDLLLNIFIVVVVVLGGVFTKVVKSVKYIILEFTPSTALIHPLPPITGMNNFFFCTGISVQGLVLARQVLSHLTKFLL